VSSDPYYRAIGRHGLLSAAEEKALAERLCQTREDAWRTLLGHEYYVAPIATALKRWYELPDHLVDELTALEAAAARVQRRAMRQALSKSERTRRHVAFAEARDRAISTCCVTDRGLGYVTRVRAALDDPTRHGFPRYRPSKRRDKYLARLSRYLAEYQAMKHRFVQANMRLVMSIARNYANYNLLSFDDLVQEGGIGLMTAVDRYDPSRNFRFSTYATWWIRHQTNRAMANHGRTIRLPAHMVSSMSKVRRAIAELYAEGEDVTPQKVSDQTTIPVRKVLQVLAHLSHPASLDGETEWHQSIRETVSDDDAPPFDALIDDERLRDELEWAMSCLTKQEAEVVKARFGFEGGEKTLAELGSRFSLSRERIRQIQNAGVAKLRVLLDDDEWMRCYKHEDS